MHRRRGRGSRSFRSQSWGWFPKKTPREVEGGVRARGRFGETWWAKRWLEALNAFGWSNRLSRGRSYARRGQVVGYEIRPGRVTAQVQGTQSRPYDVTIRVKTLKKADWDKVVDAMVTQAIFAARLLSGEMPEQIDEAFQAARLSLFPQSAGDLQTDCSCPDWANPCKHVAAVCFLLGEAFDLDPFAIFKLRGMERDDLLARLRARRGVDEPTESLDADIAAAPPEEPVDLPIDSFWSGPPAITVRIEPPLVEAAVLKRLGEPAFWTGPRDLTTDLQKTYRKASATALRMAFAPARGT